MLCIPTRSSFCCRQHSPSGMSIAVTTTPMVLVTASPTFLARVPPSSSSTPASASSAQRDHFGVSHKITGWKTFRRTSFGKARTFKGGSLLEADVTDPHRGQTPAFLRDRCSFGRAAVAEALPAGTAVMLGVVVLEDCVTLMAHLVREDEIRTDHSHQLTVPCRTQSARCDLNTLVALHQR